MKDVMLDLETLGTRPGCVVFALGACAMNLAQGHINSNVFYAVINVASAQEVGLVVQDDTLAWWRDQEHDALKELHTALQSGGGLPLKTVLEDFSTWMSPFNCDKVHVWGNGADFDAPILAEAYNKLGMPVPWRWSRLRCYRTAKNLLPGPKFIEPEIKHHALHDAVAQARHLMLLLTEYNPHKYRPPAPIDE